MNVVGFSRGGTHLFWCFLSAHPSLISRELEINDLFGVKRMGFLSKVHTEIQLILGSDIKLGFKESGLVVEKGVCSWWQTALFHYLKRHNPLKYIIHSRLRDHITIFLVKSPEEQYTSWKKRGCSKQQFERAYEEHLTNWKKYSTSHQAIFVRYDDFKMKPVVLILSLWHELGLSKTELPNSIRVKLKKSKVSPELPSASELNARAWTEQSTDFLVESLQKDYSESTDVGLNIQELYESIDYFS